MAHALAAFIEQQMTARKWRQRDVVSSSGLSRALVSKYAADERDRLTRLPERATLEGFAKAFNVPIDVLIGKAVEALGLGYTSGDFINSVATATHRELLDEIERRLTEGGGAYAGSAAPNTTDIPTPTHPVALTLLSKTDWNPAAALALAEEQPDTADTALAADEIRALIPLTPAGLMAARRNAERPPPEVGEQDGD
jgi:transcriptional regulator with XRE-family HTH domain